MEFTRRYWTVASLCAFLAVAAIAFDRPVLLFPTAGLFAWLVGAQYSFTRELASADEALSVDYSLSPERGNTSTTFTAAVSATLSSASTLALTVALQPSPAVRGVGDGDGSCRLDPGVREATGSTTFRAPVAGRVTFDPPAVTAVDRFGLVSETLVRGDAKSVTVDSTRLDDIHVGRGGAYDAEGYASRRNGLVESSLDFADVRDYVPGDPANRIDWNVSARLGRPIVVDFETDAGLRSLLVVDNRSELSVGPAGRTKFDYNREVALNVVGQTATTGDPIGLYVVGEDGLTDAFESSTSTEQYQAVRSTLLTLQPSSAEGRRTNTRPSYRYESFGTPSAAARTRESLRGDDSAFASSIRPFVAAAEPYLSVPPGDSLRETIRRVHARERGESSLFVFTDDSHLGELRESLAVVSEGNVRVSVFITPTVLFDPEALTDPKSAYERYREFESSRRRIDAHPNVRAFEVAPRSRLKSVLDAGRASEGDDRRPVGVNRDRRPIGVNNE